MGETRFRAFLLRARGTTYRVQRIRHRENGWFHLKVKFCYTKKLWSQITFYLEIGSEKWLHQWIFHVKSNFKTLSTIEIWRNIMENMSFWKHSQSWIVTSLLSRKKPNLYKKGINQKFKKIRSLRKLLRKNWFVSKYKNLF